MNSFLSYSYTIGLTETQRAEIDEQVKTAREQFVSGFSAGTQSSVKAYLIYLLAVIGPAYAAESAGNTAAATTAKNAAVKAADKKSFSKRLLETFLNLGFLGSCTAVQCGEWYIGFVCGFLFAFLQYKLIISKSK